MLKKTELQAGRELGAFVLPQTGCADLLGLVRLVREFWTQWLCGPLSAWSVSKFQKSVCSWLLRDVFDIPVLSLEKTWTGVKRSGSGFEIRLCHKLMVVLDKLLNELDIQGPYL